MLVLFAVHCAAAALAPPLVRWLGRGAFPLLALVPAAAGLWALGPWLDGGADRVETVSWIPGLHLDLALRADPLAWLMVLIVGGVGALIVAYCGRYFAGNEPGLGAFAGELIAFAAAMLGLVLADDLILLYVFWELTTVFSYLLIGYDAEKAAARRAATQAIVITTFGGLAMLVGLVVLGQEAGTFRLSEIVADPPGGTAVSVALVLVLAGALSKSAIMPFGLWLPAAMAAPTPVSAFLHAAAMVKAGVFLVARLAPAFAAAPVWRPVVLVLGTATMVLAGWRALRENDLKLLLAYGTVSQLAFMIVLLGEGTAVAALAGFTILLAHALFKAALFMVVGIIDSTTGTRDLRELRGLARSAPVLCAIAVAAAASMAGVPATLGFAGKEAAYEAFIGGRPLLLALLVIGSAFTAAYSLRFVWGAFAGRAREARERTPVEPAGALFLLPPALLSAAGVALGLLASPMHAPLVREAEPYPGGDGYHLAAWHGFGAALLLTAVTLVGGVALFLAGGPAGRLHRRLAPAEPEAVYRRIMRRLNDTAFQVTGTVQRGSLPGYLETILVTAVLLAGAVVVAGIPWPGGGPWRWWDGLPQLMVAALTATAAVAAVRARGRAQTVVLAGASGYGVSVLFALQGAPDLALTQLLMETASLVVFVLVLRQLPRGYSRTARWRRRLHVAVGTLAGLLAAGLTLLAARARQAEPISGGYPAAAEEAGGSNIVAMLLVDMRAWDTLGESSVIALAALGVTSMVFARRRRAPWPRAADAAAGTAVWSVRGMSPPGTDTTEEDEDDYREPNWLAAAAYTLAAERRTIVIEVVARLVFHTVLLYSLYLLFTAHSAPGGGFVGGIVAGLALAIRYLAGGPFELAEAAPVKVGLLLGAGMVVTSGTTFCGLLWGGEILESGSLDVHLPLLGEVHMTTSLVFDFGVYLIVLGLIMDILGSLGAEADRAADEESGR
ncbi:Na+/H+ antiporter subunit A [Actinomadura sp. 21ATH]|uniref:Na+/H+ antiporter subunit A n=1 Tax=Actinomadura sp. 21ATH TaxID=1735444 RepID=UPI0035BEC642